MKLKSPARIFTVFLVALASLLVLRAYIDSDISAVPGRLRRLLGSTPSDSTRTRPLTRFESKLFEALGELEVREEEIETRFFLEDALREIEAAVPRGRPLEWVVWHVMQSTDGTSYRVTDCVLDRNGACRIDFESSNDSDPATVVTITRANRFLSDAATMAVLLEEFDFGADQTTIDILSFPEPLTLSLVPDKEKAGWTAQAATEYNKEIVIAVPLESHTVPRSKAPSPMIMVHHEEDKIRRTIDDFAKIIPQFSGFCNLLGSRACEDSRVMRIVLEEVKKRHGYFVDTREARGSVTAELADQLGVPYAEVTASVAKGDDGEHIEEQLRHQCLVAQKRGRLLLRAPATQAFISALTNVHGVLRRNGVRLVPVSEIVNQPANK